MLSEASILLIEHWEAMEDVFAAERRLREELTAFLSSLEQSLKTTSWWSSDWHFIKQSDEQVYLSHSRWRAKSEFVLWLGVELFNAKALFGKEAAPLLYLWVKGNASLTAELRSMVEEKQISLPGEPSRKPQGYIVRRFIPKCLPADSTKFDEFVRVPILEFFSACVNNERLLSHVVAKHLGVNIKP